MFLQLLFCTVQNIFQNINENMRSPRTPWTLFCSAAVVFFGTSLAEHVIHERSVESTGEWVKIGGINRNGLLPVSIGLTQRNLDLGHQLLMERYVMI